MVTPIALGDLARHLGIERGEMVSIVGGGGKTTTLFALGSQLAGTTILTTTTKMGAEQAGDFATLFDPTEAELSAELAANGRALVWKAADERRAIGVSPETCDRWFDLADNVVIEADGSRKRPFKAPAAHEPVVPSRTTLLIACIGAGAFGQSIDKACHRPDLVAALAGCDVAAPLTPARVATVLLSEHGSRKGLPAGARFVMAICRVRPEHQTAIDELAALTTDTGELVAVAEGVGLS